MQQYQKINSIIRAQYKGGKQEMKSVYESIMTGLAEAIEDAQSSEKN